MAFRRASLAKKILSYELSPGSGRTKKIMRCPEEVGRDDSGTHLISVYS